MFVCANYMKSYVVPPEEFARNAQLSQIYGADAVYIVDSAGGMLTRDMEAYFKAIQDTRDIAVGFHGHDNLGLAGCQCRPVPRSWELWIIDTSLQGMGRSAGNTPTELFIAVMERLGVPMGSDLFSGDGYRRKIHQAADPARRGLNSLDIVSGYAQFHPATWGVIRSFSLRKFGVDPRSS